MVNFIKYWTLVLLFIVAFAIPVIAQDISAMEYFIDTDPGIGSATSITITGGSIVNETFVVPTSGLSVGFHRVVFRVQDLNNVWSVSNSRTFYISASNLTTTANISAMEYYIDVDPGFGNALPLTITPSSTINIAPTIPTASLAVGFHRLHIRALDSDGLWSNISTKSFYVANSDVTTRADIITMEYYIDTDPGFGAGTNLGITAGTTIDFTSTLSTITLAPGYHELHVRALDIFGNWSEIESRSFLIDALTSGNITAYEYFFDIDPGYGAATNVSIIPPAASIDQTENISTSALAVGSYELGIRLINENNAIGLTDYYVFTVCDVATPNFAPDVVCVGSSTTFTETSTLTLTGDIFSWDFDGDGSNDVSASSGNQTFSYPSSGLFDAKLTIDRAGCVNSITVQVQVESLPVSDAGIDQVVCNTTATMTANSPSSGETGEWSILSGTATITDPVNPTTTITGIATNTVDLAWTLTNTLGSCNDQNSVQITANLPITSMAQAVSVDIGQTLNIDVQTSSVINPGDILTTTIITSPTAGLAVILTNGTIDYTPDQNAVTSDSFVFRVTNQCGNFDERNIDITIANSAPAINVTSIAGKLDFQELTFDLSSQVSDPNNNLDLSSFRVVTQPTSGAQASIDTYGVLTIDYTGVIFSGVDQLEIEICDLSGICTTQIITVSDIETGNPPIEVYNAVSPNGDGFHDFLEIENIESYPNNRVVILNKQGNEVAQYTGYNNSNVVFSDNTLPSGIYYYFILSGTSGVGKMSGHFVLKTE